MIAGTGWTWDEVGRLTMPRLKALNRYWKKHPPVHLLVASYLGYEMPVEFETESEDDTVDAAIAPGRTPWMNGMGAIPASESFRDARTTAEALAAAERLFFGTLMEI